jgi:catechol 2,3-dioxygenase-like lactoylglutathione lyase family enzyme
MHALRTTPASITIIGGRRQTMIKAIKFVNIPVTDQDRALEFYTKKLGFRVMTDAPFDGRQRWIELGIPRAETRLVLFTAPGQHKMIGGFMNLSFVTDDVEATAVEMKGKGVEFVQDPQKADWGTSAIFKDPDGNQFVLSSG